MNARTKGKRMLAQKADERPGRGSRWEAGKRMTAAFTNGVGQFFCRPTKLQTRKNSDFRQRKKTLFYIF